MLYVEGARDREILGCWARRTDPGLARCIERSTVILGGRRPARARADFRERGGVAAGFSGLIVLDRDDHQHEPMEEVGGAEGQAGSSDGRTNETLQAEQSDFATDESGLEVFVWSLRHIESYLLVPGAIRRMLRLDAGDRTVERFIADTANSRSIGNGSPPAGLGVAAQESVHAKRILGAGGSLSEALGAELHAGDIARAMRPKELHEDVRALFSRIAVLSGLAVDGPEVVIRPSPLVAKP